MHSTEIIKTKILWNNVKSARKIGFTMASVGFFSSTFAGFSICVTFSGTFKTDAETVSEDETISGGKTDGFSILVGVVFSVLLVDLALDCAFLNSFIDNG